MKVLRYALLLALGLGFIGLTETANAQIRTGGHAFVALKGGINYYQGDINDQMTFPLRSNDGDEIGGGGAIEIGYKLTPKFSVGLEGAVHSVPILNQAFQNEGFLNSPDADEARFFLGLNLRYLLSQTSRAVPFVELNLSGFFGGLGDANIAGLPNNAEPHGDGDGFGFYPNVGLGFEYALTEKAALFAEGNFGITLPDGPFDDSEKDDDFDYFSTVYAGLLFNLGVKRTPVEILAVDGPNRLLVGESGTYTVRTNDDADAPVTYAWNFGDGAMGSGMTVSHAFARPGTYDVTVTATNRAGSQSRSVSTLVVEPPPPVVAPQIVALSASPSVATTGERVSFDATVTGTEPITCRWTFGDGSTGTGCDATHTYTAPGTYTATLTATNSAGSDSRSVTVTVNPVQVDPCDEVVDMSTVFFRRNSSVLTDEGRARLLDNAAILADCPALNVQVDGYASPGENSPQRLSEARARAVEQFYLDNGVAASRIVATGRGAVTGVSRKEDGSIYRYVTSTPFR